jgi:hypothetical protein
MLDPDIPPVEEGEADADGDAVRQTAVDRTLVATASSMGESTLLPWITVIARR